MSSKDWFRLGAFVISETAASELKEIGELAEEGHSCELPQRVTLPTACDDMDYWGCLRLPKLNTLCLFYGNEI